MAGIFAPTLQSEVSPVRAVETPSAAGALANLASDVASGFFRAQDARAKREEARQPSYTERKDQFETKILGDYTRELTALQQTADQNGWSSTELARKQSNLDLKYLQAGLDTSSSGFKAAKTTVTGKPAEDFGISEDELFIQSVQSREGGEGLIVSAKLDLISKDLDPNDITNVAANLRDQEAKAAELVRLTTDETLTVASGKKIFTTSLDDLVNESQTAIQALTSAGAAVPAEAIQNQYLKVRALEQQARSFIARNPNADDNDIADIEKAITRAEAVFEVAGVQFDGGEFKQMGPVELKAADRLKQTITILQSSPDVMDNIIAAGLTDGSIKKDPALLLQADARIKALGDVAPVQPDWITEEGIIVSNSLMKSYDNLISFQTNPERTMEKAVDGAMSLLSQDERDKWMGMDNVQSWSAVKAYSSAAKITGDNVALTPRQAEATFKNIVAMSVGFEQIDINSEAVSFDGIRNEISADLPRILAKLKQADPTKGALAEEMVYRSLVGQKLAYDQRVKSDEAAMNVVYDATSNSYTFKADELDPVSMEFKDVLDKRYGGNLVRAMADRFAQVQASDLTEEARTEIERRRKQGIDLTPQGVVTTRYRSLIPDEAALKNLTDLRNSSVYLSRLGAQLEPEGAKEARQIAQETADTVGVTAGSVTAQLIDQYEAGRGGYRTLFGQAQEAGKPFEGFDVTTKTLGELYEFSNPSGAAGTYGAYVKEANPEGVLATPMGRYQFVGKTLRQVAKDMNLPDSTVFTPEVQDSMFLFLARQVTNGKSQKGKRDALRGTWAGFKSASDAQLDQMIGEIESGNPDLGAGAFASTNARMTPEVTVTPLADRGPEVQASAPVASIAPAGGAVGATGIPAEATLDPTITQDTPENQVGDAPSAPTDQTAALNQAEGLSTEVQGFLANLDEDIPADKVQALLDYFGIKADTEFGNMIANALSRGETDAGKARKAEALQYFLNQLNR